MARKIISKGAIDPMAGVYVIPDPRIYDKKILPGDPTWKEVYGKIKCVRCGQPLLPGESYTAKSTMVKNRGWRFDVTHFDLCEPPKKQTKFLRKIQKETIVPRPVKGAPGTCDSCGKKGLHHPKDELGKRDTTKLECRFCHSTIKVEG